MFRSTAFAAALGLATLPAAAEEGGTVTLTLDGEELVFPLWASQSDWSGWGAPDNPSGSVNIYTRPVDEATWERFKGFTLGFRFAGTQADGGEAGLTMADGDAITRLYGEGEEAGMEVVVDAIEVMGEELSVAGSFTTVMGPSDNYGRDIDLSDPVEVEGRFDVVLGPVE